SRTSATSNRAGLTPLQEELAVTRGHRARRIVLPPNHMDDGDATPELEDVGARTCGRRAGRAQIVDREVDRLGPAGGAALVDQSENRRQLEECAQDAAVNRRQHYVADDFLAERQHALEPAVDPLSRNAEKAGVRNRREHRAHGCSSPPSGAPPGTRRWN